MLAGELPNREIVLIVDDAPANLDLLSIALEQAGMVPLVALDAQMALEQLKLIRPGVILLDVIMPGMDGFELCRTLQADPGMQDIPVIFMTAVDDTDHVVQGFSDGAVDYVVKPVRPGEVVARIRAHLRRAQPALQARASLEFAELAVVALDAQGTVLWSTQRAQELLSRYFPGAAANRRLPEALGDWARTAFATPEGTIPRFSRLRKNDRLEVTIKLDRGLVGGVLLLSEEIREWPAKTIGQGLGLTAREAEILMWVAYGKTNRQIGEILGISPRTVNKHLDNIFPKLGVETRTAAATVAIRNAIGTET